MTPPSAWTSPDDIKRKVQRLWDSGRLLSAGFTSESLFPLRFSVRGPNRSEIGARFSDVRAWIKHLQTDGRSEIGFGYVIEWSEINSRQLGRNKWPAAVVFETERDAFEFVRTHQHATRFRQLVAESIAQFPMLREWIERHPMIVLEYANDWSRVLAVLEWFRLHPRPGLYLRQLDIEGVDTKFMETRKGLVSELLDQILPDESVVQSARGVSAFEQRYGLRSKPVIVRCRPLSDSIREEFLGFSDLAVPIEEFARLRPKIRRVFITENEINGLVFPDIPESLMLFGMGFRVTNVATVPWLRETTVYYWGDIDTSGFAILAHLRGGLPNVRSWLMDRKTLMAHRSLWGQEPQQDHGVPRHGLSTEEGLLYEDLKQNRLGDRVRLEQERISFGWVQQAIRTLVDSE